MSSVWRQAGDGWQPLTVPEARGPGAGTPTRGIRMRRFLTRSPPADGGHPVDSDLHQMTDDGCPHGPDPARWAYDDWRDNLGEWDTFEDEVRTDSSGRRAHRPAALPAHS